jgi:hypothetical protein
VRQRERNSSREAVLIRERGRERQYESERERESERDSRRETV